MSTSALFLATAWAQTDDRLSGWHSLEGRWAGYLSYRDYRSNEWVQIRHQRDIELAPDASWMSMRSSYNDPGREVFGLELVQKQGSAVFIASTGNQGIEVRELVMATAESAVESQQWRLLGEATDNGRLARIEYRWHIRGDELTIETWVEHLDDSKPGNEPFLRNRIDLERQSRGS